MSVGLQGVACQGCGVPAGGPGQRARACGGAMGRSGGQSAPSCAWGTGPIAPAPSQRAEGAHGVNSIA
jgi:hypothetical protein